MRRSEASIDEVRVRTVKVPTDLPESDGTLEWNSTTLVIVEISAAGQSGIGYGYADTATAELIRSTLAETIRGLDALSTNACCWAMVRRIRNLGRPGIASMAISCVDVALWDLKGKILGVPVIALLGGAVRDSVPVYGSGGFTSYTDQQLAAQLGGWANSGITMVKMKIGRDAVADRRRVRVAREAIGRTTELFVDANGAYTVKEALEQAQHFANFDVRWFEEPVSSDNLDGLNLVRRRAPAQMEIAAGEYGYDASYFRRMLDAQAVDVLQADATRCGGYTGFLQAAQLCVAYDFPLSCHTAPLLHVNLGCACERVRHLEYFHDHVRIERMVFDGVEEPKGGHLAVNKTRPGLGIELKHSDLERYAA